MAVSEDSNENFLGEPFALGEAILCGLGLFGVAPRGIRFAHSSLGGATGSWVTAEPNALITQQGSKEKIPGNPHKLPQLTLSIASVPKNSFQSFLPKLIKSLSKMQVFSSLDILQ